MHNSTDLLLVHGYSDIVQCPSAREEAAAQFQENEIADVLALDRKEKKTCLG